MWRIVLVYHKLTKEDIIQGLLQTCNVCNSNYCTPSRCSFVICDAHQKNSTFLSHSKLFYDLDLLNPFWFDFLRSPAYTKSSCIHSLVAGYYQEQKVGYCDGERILKRHKSIKSIFISFAIHRNACLLLNTPTNSFLTSHQMLIFKSICYLQSAHTNYSLIFAWLVIYFA